MIHPALLVCRQQRIVPADRHCTPLRARKAAVDPIALKLAAVLLEAREQGGPELYRAIDDAVITTAFDFCHRSQPRHASLE